MWPLDPTQVDIDLRADGLLDREFEAAYLLNKVYPQDFANRFEFININESLPRLIARYFEEVKDDDTGDVSYKAKKSPWREVPATFVGGQKVIVRTGRL